MTKHPIRFVAKMTGLSPGLIRIWERRYGAVKPIRTETNRRLYCDEDIERLYLLSLATQAGESISQIATLSLEELKKLIGGYNSLSRGDSRSAADDVKVHSGSEYLAGCFEAIKGLDAETLESVLMQASVGLSRRALFEQVVGPLMYSVGDMWRDGELKVVHEHLASAVVRTFLSNMSGAYKSHESAPAIVVTTPAGQIHEFGALMANITAASSGWRTVYLGPNIPAGDIASAVIHNNARAVALSVVYPADDPRVSNELEQLHGILGDKVRTIVGGRSVEAYSRVIERIDAIMVSDLLSLQTQLDAIRSGNAGGVR